MNMTFTEDSKRFMRDVFDVLFLNEIRPPYQQSRMDYNRLGIESNLSYHKVDRAVTDLCVCGYAQIHYDQKRNRNKVSVRPTSLGMRRYQNFIAGV